MVLFSGMKKLLPVCCAALLLFAVVRAEDEDGDKKKDKESVGTVIGIDLGTTYSWYAGNFCMPIIRQHVLCYKAVYLSVFPQYVGFSSPKFL